MCQHRLVTAEDNFHLSEPMMDDSLSAVFCFAFFELLLDDLHILGTLKQNLWRKLQDAQGPLASIQYTGGYQYMPTIYDYSMIECDTGFDQ